MPLLRSFFDRAVAELFGRCRGYAYVGDGVQSAIGNYTRRDVDLPVSMGALTWARTYNSLDVEGGVLGRGWTPSFGPRLDVADDRVVLHDQSGRALTFVAEEGGSYRRPQDIEADLRRAEPGDEGAGDDVEFTLRFFSGVVWRFGRSGRLLSSSQPGERVDLSYDASELLEHATHSAGGRLRFSYGPNGLLARVVSTSEGDQGSGDGEGGDRAVTYEYDGEGPDAWLTVVNYPDGPAIRYTRTDDGRMHEVIDADGVSVVTNIYDDRGRVSAQQAAGAGGVELAYDPPDTEPGTTVVTTTPTGTRTIFRHDAAARVIAVTDPLGGTSTVEHDTEGRITAATSAGGTRLAWEYDDRGDLASASVGEATVVYTYDDEHRRTSSTGPTGLVTRWAYDGDEHHPATVTDPSGAVTGYTYRDGLLLARQDADGATTRFRYDGRRDLVAVVDPAGGTTRYAYDVAGRRTAEFSPTGEVTRWEYDAVGRPLSVTDPAGHTTRYTYTTAGRPLEITDALGATARNEFDPQGRLAAHTDALGARTAYEYDDVGGLSAVIDPDGARTTIARDQLNRVASVTDPLGTTVGYTYDAEGNTVAEERPAGTTTTEYDALGNPVSITDPTGATVRFGYDALNRPVEVTDAAGGVWRTTYDDERRAVATTDPTGAVTVEHATPAGRTSTSLDPLGRRTSYDYDAAGRLIAITDPVGGRTSFGYDTSGRRISTTTPAGLVRQVEYERGRAVATVDARGWITRYRYDARGRRTELITPGGATTRYGHDAGGKLVAVTDPRGGVTRYEYNRTGRLVRSVDAQGAATRYTHDAAGRRTSTTDPLGRTTRFEYDAAGNLTTIIEPTGNTIRREYDARGDVLKVSADDGTEVRYTYDAAGRRVEMTDARGTTHYAYDAGGRLSTVTEPDGGVLTAEYDAAGQRVLLRYPDGAQVHYRYDLAGRLIGIRDSQAGEAAYAVDPDGRLITEQLPGGWARRYGYDGGLLARFVELRAGVPAARTELERDPDGRIVTRADHLAGFGPSGAGPARRHYGYDPTGQLVSITGPDQRVTLAYDIVGNRTALDRGGEQTRYLYDAADQLVAVEERGRRIGYRYDQVGRLVEEYDGDLRHAITYDGLGAPREITRTRAWARERAELQFNGDGLLVDLTLADGDDSAPPTTICYRWSVGDRLPQILTQQVHTEVPQADDTAPAGRDLASARFTYGYGRAFATAAHGSATFARDAFGSAIRTEQTRPWTAAAGYDEFGLPESGGVEPDRAPGLAPQIPRFGYRGELTFGSAQYLRARTYDGALGRFTTRDPVSAAGVSSLAANPYTYALNDPLNRVDPAGTWSVAASPFGAVIELAGNPLPPIGTGCAQCSNPGNGRESHPKCFQNTVCLFVRGFRRSFTEDALDAEPNALKTLYYSHRPERAAQCMAIHELNWRRESVWDSTWDKIYARTTLSQKVDWEVGTRSLLDLLELGLTAGFRIDITTQDSGTRTGIFEAKEWTGPATTAEVTAQLGRYTTTGALLALNFMPSTELNDWADAFDVTTGVWSWFRTPWTDKTVYVWGLDLPPGHIYFAEDDKADDKVKSKAQSKHGLGGIPPAVPIPVPVPVEPVPVVP